MLGCKPVDFLMDPNPKLLSNMEAFEEAKTIQETCREVKNLTRTRLYVAYTTSVASQFLSSPQTSHWDEESFEYFGIRSVPLSRGYGIQTGIMVIMLGSLSLTHTTCILVLFRGILVSKKNKTWMWFQDPGQILNIKS